MSVLTAVMRAAVLDSSSYCNMSQAFLHDRRGGSGLCPWISCHSCSFVMISSVSGKNVMMSSVAKNNVERLVPSVWMESDLVLHLSVCQSIYRSIYLFIHPSMQSLYVGTYILQRAL